MVKPKRNLLSAALASALTLFAVGLHAQETPAPAGTDDAKELDTVVVTGIRAAIEQATETKRSSTSIVEAISSEDIGKLPDTSIADSLARLPGLTAQRFGNRPQEINIRGFAGDFSTALLNGREQVSLGNNRGVEFDQYPSELINQVVVYKTPDASLVGQGLSGTVDLRTVRPLDYGERVTAINLRGDRNRIPGSDADGYRFSISHVNQFADNTVGLAIGYARLDNPGQGHVFESWGYDNGVLQGGNIFDSKYDNRRDGLMGVLQFRPNDNYSTTLDVFYSKFDKEETKRGVQFATGGWAGGVLTGRTDNANGTAVVANYELGFINNRNDFNAAYDDLFAIGWNHELKLGENWTFTADISNSSATRDERILETYARLIPGTTTTLTATLNPKGYFDFDFGLDLTDPSNFRLMDPGCATGGCWGAPRAQAGYLKDFEVKDELTSLRFDLERAFSAGPFRSVSFGANLTDRTKSRASSETTLCAFADCDQSNNVGLPVPAQFITDSDLNFAGVSFLGLDPVGLLNSGTYVLLPKDHADISKKNWDVNERVTTAYVQLNIDTDLGSIPVRGNVGVQAVNVDQSSSGLQSYPNGGAGDEISGTVHYTDYLPSMNLSFELPASQFIRLGAAKQMARPRMDEIRINNDIYLDAGTDGNLPDEWRGRQHWAMSGGNVELLPWLANAYDIAYEKYFADNKGYVSAAYFYKDLDTYIYTQNGEFDIRETSLPPEAYLPGIDPIGRFSRPANGEGGTISGWEFAVSIPFEILWAPLEGFGIQANYSDTDSEIQPFGPGTSEPLPGLSKYVSNATVYFERWGFSARVSQRRRSEFLGEVQGLGGDRTRINFSGETVTDVQMGYTFQSGPLKDLSILAQVNNLENEPYRTNVDGMEDRPNGFSEYGRTYLLGVNYRF